MSNENNENLNDKVVTPKTTAPEASGASKVEKEENRKKAGGFYMSKKALLIALASLLALLLLIGAILLGHKEATKPKAATPIPIGHTIVVPDPTDAGKPVDPSKQALNPDNSAPTYVDPTDINTYRKVDTNGNVTIDAPLDGKCALNEKGEILPPDNYMHICYYEKNGAVFYTSHAIIGPKTGALENIQYLKPGMTVVVDGKNYKVDKVNTFMKDKLPNYLFRTGVVALVTCHIDASVKVFSDFTKTDVVTLTKA